MSQLDLPFGAAAAASADRLRDLGRALRAVGADATLRTLCRLVFDMTNEGAQGRTWTATRADIVGHIWGPACSPNTLTRAITDARGDDTGYGLLNVAYTTERNGAIGPTVFSINWQAVAMILGQAVTATPPEQEPLSQNLGYLSQNLGGVSQNLGYLSQIQGEPPQAPPDETHNIPAHARAHVRTHASVSDSVSVSDDDVRVRDKKTPPTEPTEGPARDGLSYDPQAVDWPAAVALAAAIRSRLYPHPAALVEPNTEELILTAAAMAQIVGPEGPDWIDRALAACKVARLKNPGNPGGYFRGCLCAGLVETLGHHTQGTAADREKAAKAELADAIRQLRPETRLHVRAIRPLRQPPPPPPAAQKPTEAERRAAQTELRAEARGLGLIYARANAVGT